MTCHADNFFRVFLSFSFRRKTKNTKKLFTKNSTKQKTETKIFEIVRCHESCLVSFFFLNNFFILKQFSFSHTSRMHAEEQFEKSWMLFLWCPAMTSLGKTNTSEKRMHFRCFQSFAECLRRKSLRKNAEAWCFKAISSLSDSPSSESKHSVVSEKHFLAASFLSAVENLASLEASLTIFKAQNQIKWIDFPLSSDQLV